MKGTSFQNGVEFKIHLEGETWSQGDTITGTLETVARNPGATPPTLHVTLAEATERRIKSKHPEAYDEIGSETSARSPIALKFILPIDARITDKAGSIYALYGADATGSKTESAPPKKAKAKKTTDGAGLASLKLNIIPHQHLRDFCDLMSTHFRFAFKAFYTGKKGRVEAKYDPPAGTGWVSLEQLLIELKIDGDLLLANFLFDRAEIDPSKPGTNKVKVTRTVEREWNLSEMLHDFNQRLNKDAAILAVDSVIEEYRAAGWLA